MISSQPTTVEEIIDALRQLGGTAEAKEIKEKVMENRGGMPPQYKSLGTYFNTIQRIIENYCPQSDNYQGKGYFERISKGLYRLMGDAKKDIYSKPNGASSTKSIRQLGPKVVYQPNQEIEDNTKTTVETIRKLIEAKEERYSTSGVFDPNNIEDAREKVSANIARRRGQPKFRKDLLYAYKGQCVITGCDVEEVLEAAHIIGYKGPQTNNPSNGLLLRADIHTLFDMGLIGINTEAMTVVLSKALFDSDYYRYHGKRIAEPIVNDMRPNKEALDKHRREAKL